jgi:DNA invertase Pin-like site-specific DNA recombinase
MQQPEHLPREDDRRAGRPARASPYARPPGPRRRGDGDAHRPACAQHLRFVRIVKRIVDAKAQFRSLAEPWADTGTSTGRLMLAVLGGLADMERDLIRTRTAEGRSRAKAQVKAHGAASPSPAQQKEATRRRARGATLQELAHNYNVSKTTISRL